MPPAYQQWDPYAVLGIAKSRTMCYGWAPSKNRDCHNAVAEANRLEAQRLLTRLSRHSPSSADVISELGKIARFLLCRNSGCKHQDQAGSVVAEWRGKIRDHVQSSVEPRDGDTETDDAASGEYTVDIRAQIAECQRLLSRAAAALESHQEAQRRFETLSAGSDTSTDTIRAQSTVESETPRSESASSDSEVEHAAEPLATELNLDHVQTLFGQLTLEHEASRLRRPRTVRFEEDENRQGVIASANSSTASSQTVLPSEPGHEPQVSEREQRVEGQIEVPAILPEVEGRNNISDEHSSSESITPITIGVAETETGQPENDSEPLAYANLSSWSSSLAYARTLFSHDQSNGACDEVWHQRQSQSSRRYGNFMLLAAVALYLVVLFAWYKLQVLQKSGPRRLTLDGPLRHQIGTVAGQSDVGGPVLSSLSIFRY